MDSRLVYPYKVKLRYLIIIDRAVLYKKGIALIISTNLITIYSIEEHIFVNIITTSMKAQMLLRDAGVFPSEQILRDALGKTVYSILKSFIDTIADDEYNLTIEWRYYNDGKAWLGKVIYKKKTVLWLSIWEGFFKTSFYFIEKHLEAITALDISETVKEEFVKAKIVGKLIPMIIDINRDEQLNDLLTIVRFKKSLK